MPDATTAPPLLNSVRPINPVFQNINVLLPKDRSPAHIPIPLPAYNSKVSLKVFAVVEEVPLPVIPPE